MLVQLAACVVLPIMAGAQEPLAGALPVSTTDEVAALMSALSSPDARARGDAASKLGRLGPLAAPAVPRLLAMLEDDAEFFVSDANGHVLVDTPASCASLALTRIGADAIPGLVEATRHRDWRVRRDAVEALGPASVRFNRDAVLALITALGDRNRAVRRSAALLLPRGDPQTLEPLLGAARDRDMTVRQTALGKLGAFTDPRATDVLVGFLRRGADIDAVCEATRALEHTRPADAVPALVDLLGKKRRGRDVRACAASALAAFDGPAVIAALDAGSRDPDEHVRAHASEALEVVALRGQVPVD
jgi:HEAT repeat protein